MKKENLFGGILAIIAALMGIIGHIVLFLNWYRIGMGADSAEPGCEILLKYHPPIDGRYRHVGWGAVCGERLRLFHQEKLGILSISDSPCTGVVGKLVHQCAVYGCQPAADLLPAVLALCAALFLIPEGGR